MELVYKGSLSHAACNTMVLRFNYPLDGAHFLRPVEHSGVSEKPSVSLDVVCLIYGILLGQMATQRLVYSWSLEK